MKKDVRLFNVILPIWIIWLFPPILLVCIVANTIIDFVVTYVCLKHQKISDPFQKAKKVLFKVVCFGFLADFIGAAILIAITYLPIMLRLGQFSNDMMRAISYNPFENIWAFLLIALVIGIVAAIIYKFSMKYSLDKLDLALEEKKKVAAWLAIFTAPYTFLIPMAWFW